MIRRSILAACTGFALLGSIPIMAQASRETGGEISSADPMEQAMPEMMYQFGDMELRVEQALAQLPDERTFEELTQTERQRMSALIGTGPTELEAVILPPDYTAIDDRGMVESM